MDDLEALRAKRLRELQEQAAHQDRAAEEEAAQRAEQQDAAIEELLQQVLTPEARERLTNIRLSRPDFATKVTQQLVALVQSGRLRNRLDDAGLKVLLQQMTPKDRDISIRRK